MLCSPLSLVTHSRAPLKVKIIKEASQAAHRAAPLLRMTEHRVKANDKRTLKNRVSAS